MHHTVAYAYTICYATRKHLKHIEDCAAFAAIQPHYPSVTGQLAKALLEAALNHGNVVLLMPSAEMRRLSTGCRTPFNKAKTCDTLEVPQWPSEVKAAAA